MSPAEAGGTRLPTGRLGVGPAVPVLDLSRSWATARTALRFTAEGTAHDPGPSVVHAAEPGGVALLTELVVPGAEPPPDVHAPESAVADAPRVLVTLYAVAATASLRAAAAEVRSSRRPCVSRRGWRGEPSGTAPRREPPSPPAKFRFPRRRAHRDVTVR